MELDPGKKFNLWMGGAVVALILGAVVGFLEQPRWAVGPLIALALICCVGMINNAVAEAARERRREAAPSPSHQSTGTAGETGEVAEETTEETAVRQP